MQEIFSLQRKLNRYTLGNIGVDFESAIKDPEQKVVWIENYRKALSAELAELVKEVDAYGIGSRNGKVEIVDMLHFLVSLSHIVEVGASEVSIKPVAAPSFVACTVRTFLALDDLQNSMKWKWWAKGGGYKSDAAKGAVLELWKCFEEMCAVFDMDLDTVKRIYIAKNEVNFKRQEQNYNEDTKTEADNLALDS